MQKVFEKIIERLGNEIFSAELYGNEWNGQTVTNLLCLGNVRDVIEQTVAEYNNGWIPVGEKLPEESLNSVLCWDEYRKRCCFAQYLGGRWILGNDVDSVKITAWQPLPEPYQKGE